MKSSLPGNLQTCLADELEVPHCLPWQQFGRRMVVNVCVPGNSMQINLFTGQYYQAQWVSAQLAGIQRSLDIQHTAVL